MEPSLESLLKRSGISSSTITVLENEMIISESIFFGLSNSHLQHILPKVKVGQHVLLTKIWNEHFKDYDGFNRAQSLSYESSSSVSPSRSRSPFSPVSSAAEKPMSPNDDIKDLVQLYKTNAVSRFNKGSGSSSQSGSTAKKQETSVTTMKILLGGMVYDVKKGKGIRRKFLPEPNPTQVEFNKSDTLLAVCEKAIDLYYREFDITMSDVFICDSSGVIVECDLQQKLFDYYAVNGYVPSRHKLYTLVKLDSKKKVEKVQEESVNSKAGNLEGHPPKPSFEETEPVIKCCIECGRNFRTFIPDTSCNLPDGSCVVYTEPQLTCPLCDPNGYGRFMNQDLFPELMP
ncbi:PREDICTED: uncharacterized protein LOC109587313 isoform X1 [Amphimedon queenslandica]|nr:PREDICTED: uncharacterized protein LOC109587313 isoform X1 [Amphimedon queenslandica]|eukprot:XP_019859118.1 PREDICTED: uncharacterized protein LOC109587313 isoform X1 [Amphimedon queenslandica]